MEENYEQLFKQYGQENPDWAEYLTDSTYYEMVDWYDYAHGNDNDECSSDEAREFANYVWNKYVKEPKTAEKTSLDLILDFINERIKWNEEMKKKDPKPSDIGRIEEAKCIRRYVEAMMEKQRCEGCNNVKGCITCTDGDQWAHIEEIDVDKMTEAMEESVNSEPIISFYCAGQPIIGAYSKDSLRNQFEAGIEYERNRHNKI